jgi:hypothetical protein
VRPDTRGIGERVFDRAPRSARAHPRSRALVDAGDLQLGLFDERNLAQITRPQFRGERLLVCRNPVFAAKRARKREALLVPTEAALAKVTAAVEHGRLRSAAVIGLRPGRVVGAKKLAKHVELEIADGVLAYRRRTDAIAAEAALDGLFVVRTSVPEERLNAPAVVETYKRLPAVERDLRALKGNDLLVRPIVHWHADRVRSHLFLCFLAAYVRWHLEAAWAPLLFRDEAPPRTDPSAPAERTSGALVKERDHRTPDGLGVGGLRPAARADPAPGPPIRADRVRSRQRGCSQDGAPHRTGFVLECARRPLEVWASSSLVELRPATRQPAIAL